jgi:hypothetical protein
VKIQSTLQTPRWRTFRMSAMVFSQRSIHRPIVLNG